MQLSEGKFQYDGVDIGYVGDVSFEYDIAEEDKKRLYIPEKIGGTATLSLENLTKARKKFLYRATGMLRPHTGRRGSRKR